MYNGWTNRATWLIEVWFNPESKEDVQLAKEQFEEAVDQLPGFLKDFVDTDINWDELESHFEEDDPETNPGFLARLPRTLSRADVLRYSKALRAEGKRLPRMGYCVKLTNGVEVCRDANGYYLVGTSSRSTRQRRLRRADAEWIKKWVG